MYGRIYFAVSVIANRTDLFIRTIRLPPSWLPSSFLAVQPSPVQACQCVSPPTDHSVAHVCLCASSFLQPTAHTSVVIITKTRLKTSNNFLFIFPPYAVFAGVKFFFVILQILRKTTLPGDVSLTLNMTVHFVRTPIFGIATLPLFGD